MKKKHLVCKHYVIKCINIATIFFILLACNANKTTNSKESITETYTSEISGSSYIDESGLLTLLVNVNQNEQLSLSDITDDVKKVELEISGLQKTRKKILFSESYIVMLAVDYTTDSCYIIVFDNNGKFINRIGSNGKETGKYSHINDIAADFNNKKIYVSTPSKIICYDLDGNFIYESSLKEMIYLSFLNNKLFSCADRIETEEFSKHKIRNMIYEIDNNLNITDSIEIRKNGLHNLFYMSFDDRNYLTCVEEETFLFYPSNIPNDNLYKPIDSDTLYIFKNKTLFPHLIINFGDKDEKTSTNREIEFIYRNTRFVFAKHMQMKSGGDRYFFCYDLKENKGSNMKNGFIDDIHTEEIVDIRPIDLDANRFYYLLTNSEDNKKYESSLTLYIGTLKK